jgi:branched-chain amino acid transport system substrate-binding protein
VNIPASLTRRSFGRVISVTAGVALSAMALSALPATAAKEPGVSATEIVLGMQLPQTGPASSGYNKIDDAMRAYFDYVNSKGGVYGRKIRLEVKDDTYKAGLTVSTASSLINKEKIFAFIGSVGTQTHISVIADINRRGIPDLFVNSGFSGFYTNPKKYPTTFGGLGTYVNEAKILGKYMKETFKTEKIGILYQTDDFGRNTVAGLKTAGYTFEPRKTAATFVAGTQVGGLDAQMTQLKDNGVEVVVVGAVANAFAAAVASSLKIGYKPKKWVVISVGADATTFQTILLGGKIPLATSAALLTGVITSSHAPAPGEATDEFVKAFKAINTEFNKGPDSAWDNNIMQGMNIAYQMTSVLVGVGKNGVTRKNVISWIEKNPDKITSAAFSPLGYSATTHEAFTGFWVGAYDASTVLKPVGTTRQVWTSDSGSGPVTELKWTRPAIGADSLPKGFSAK